MNLHFETKHQDKGAAAMPKLEVMPFQRMGNLQSQGKRQAAVRPTLRDMLHAGLGVALSCAKVFTGFTPFGVAFYGAAFTRQKWLIPFFAVSAGSLIACHNLTCVKYIAVMLLFTLLSGVWDAMTRTGFKAAVLGGGMLLAGLVPRFFDGILLYDVVLCICEAFLCYVGVWMMDKALPLVVSYQQRQHLSPEELISVTAMLSLVILSLSGIPPFLGLKVSNILSILLILVLNLSGGMGAGAVIGIVVGTICSVGTYNMGSIVGAYAFAGLVSGLFKPFKKWGVCLGFILANAVMTVFLNGSTEVLINIYEIFFSSLLLFLLPPEVCNFFAEFTGKTVICESGVPAYRDKMQAVMYEKLQGVANSFSDLADIYIQAGADGKAEQQRDRMRLFNQSAEAVCANCGLRHTCWHKQFQTTYQYMFSMLGHAEKSGKIGERDLPKSFRDRCIHTEQFVTAFNHRYEVYRLEQLWKQRLAENRALVRDQLGSVSTIIASLADQVDVLLDNELEGRVRVALDQAGYAPEQVLALTHDGDVVVEVKFDREGYKTDADYLLQPVVSEAAGCGMRLQASEVQDGLMHIVYRSREQFCTMPGIARRSRDGEAVCGDNFTTLSLPDGTFIAAISDGMGSGEAAAAESQNAIELLERFLESGFDREVTIRLINSSLLLNSTREMFSTIDLCAVNLRAGRAEFIKIGAAPSYIKTEDGVEEIRAASLPAGILRDVQPDMAECTLAGETILVLVSDGVSDAGEEGWVGQALAEMKTRNPQIIADKLVEKAAVRAGEHADDMTVVAVRIWENV